MGDEDKSSRPARKVFEPPWIPVSWPCGKPSQRGGEATVRRTESLPIAKRPRGTRRGSLYSSAPRKCRRDGMNGFEAASRVRREPSSIGKDVSSDKHQDYNETLTAAAPGTNDPLNLLVVYYSPLVPQA